MPNRYRILATFFVSALILLTAILVSLPSQTARAQCGSQASSCKNCHEVQGQDPVNNDGTGWHTGHAFGDFCYLCHAGNNQSMDKETAHTGMVPPLSDVQAACQSCHPQDLMERAQVYATALGVEIGNAGGAAPPEDTTAPTGGGEPSEAESSAEPASLPAPNLAMPEAELVDYNQLYAETVLGEKRVNWGNVIVGMMIFFVLVGGGAFAYVNERKLRGLPPLPRMRRKPAEAHVGSPVIEAEMLPQEVLDILPQLAKLDPRGLYALKRLLEDPSQASEMLYSLSRLDAELLRRIRNLDRDTRALLLALAGD